MRKLTLLSLWVALLAVAPFLSNCSDPLEISPTGPELQIDTLFSTDTVIVGDTVLSDKDTIFVYDTVITVDTVGYDDTLIIVDTIPLGVDTVITLDTLIDTLIVVDTVYSTDTVHTVDTVTLEWVDTVVVVDTVIQLEPCPPDDDEYCSELDSHNKEIVWLLRNESGYYHLEFEAELEKDKPAQTIHITIDGETYLWTPAHEDDHFVLDLDLDADARVEITMERNPAWGHDIEICLELEGGDDS